MAANRPKNPKNGNRPLRKRPQLESPFFEEQFDPYFQEEPEPDSLDDRVEPPDPEESWYWREPENAWQEEGMWPWPEPAPRPKQDDPP